MSIPCRIGILNPDKSIEHIYCHYDGYSRNVGKILASTYNTEDLVRKLIA